MSKRANLYSARKTHRSEFYGGRSTTSEDTNLNASVILSQMSPTTPALLVGVNLQYLLHTIFGYGLEDYVSKKSPVTLQSSIL